MQLLAARGFLLPHFRHAQLLDGVHLAVGIRLEAQIHQKSRREIWVVILLQIEDEFQLGVRHAHFAVHDGDLSGTGGFGRGAPDHIADIGLNLVGLFRRF